MWYLVFVYPEIHPSVTMKVFMRWIEWVWYLASPVSRTISGPREKSHVRS